MKRNFLFAKIHQARVTHADLEYEGSFAIDDEILELSTIQPNEQIHVYNIDNAQRFTTYAIRAKRGSRIMAANGACAHLVTPGDRVIICSYAAFEEYEWKGFKPTVVLLDERNNCKNIDELKNEVVSA
jgi:aspartate 1-decarboxylase